MKLVKEEEGFTLIEMMIVLLIISVLVLIAIPNVTKHSKSIDDKGCAAYVKMVEGQVAAYKMEKHVNPSLEDLEREGYLPNGAKCPNGSVVSIDGGIVTVPGLKQ
ncbi:competence type IV pilus major pilin ComGC [Sporosarcina luteola]|uniref:competence type IV pilus major pilin ComGC n=1 Tax=Sporosarcina luteola TaxID=582850 RepID=UPI0025596B91|nr:competence type IV pilus major pilin ComGC [Sporosarcina luteola]